MFIYQIWAIVGPDKQLKTGAILAESKSHALAVAVERIKRIEGAKVSRIVPVLDVSDVRNLHHTGLAKALSKLDQCGLVAWNLREIIARQIKMVADLREIIKTQQKGNSE